MPMPMNKIRCPCLLSAHQFILIFCVVVLVIGADAVSPFKRPGWRISADRRSQKSSVVSLKMNALQLRLRGGGAGANGNPHDDRDDGGGDAKPLVVVIDVDNTLYSERDLVSSTGAGIESQIIRNIHAFGRRHFDQSPQQCDALHEEHGSTIEGWRRTLSPDQVGETLARFYREVYDPLDHSCLLGASEDAAARSGYDHGRALQRRRALADFLQDLSRRHPVYLASNSPQAHVSRVVRGLGLGGVEFAGVLSPDMERPVRARGETKFRPLPYPTKASPEQYFQPLLDRHPPSSHRIVLLDDSAHNLRTAGSVGVEGILVNCAGRTLEEGLAQVAGHVLPPRTAGAASADNGFTFSDVQYLLAKNEVDAQAINAAVWDQLARELALRMQAKGDGVLAIADFGAGMLSMLELITSGGGKDDAEKRSLLASVNALLDSRHRIKRLEYFAYESNTNLLEGCKERLRRKGFQERQASSSESGASFTRAAAEPANDTEITLHLRPADFQAETSPPEGLDLFVGCCFADLFDPDQLARALQRFAFGGSPPLVYFPITFAGTTRFRPSLPRVPPLCPEGEMVPSDTTAFRIYSESLMKHGHNLDPSLIVEAMVGYGGGLISKGSSDWAIDPSSNKHLWDTMIYFFGMSGARELSKQHWDAAGWIKRCRLDPRTIIVSNVDLLFHLNAGSSVADTNKHVASVENDSNHGSPMVSVQEIQFVAPYNVTTVTKHWNTSSSSHLSSDQVEIESLCSLISSGTELKIFRGSFEAASLDVNIKGMEDEAMEYPLAYGYSLVGRVVACGSGVDDALIGRLVFTFSPHSNRVIVHKEAIQIVPDDISAEDAVFMPSVETALSLVHDAHIRLGENVAVYGQGLIGLLVTSILSMQSSPLVSSSDSFSSVTVLDTFDDRLGVSSTLGATSALKPDAVALAGPFDVSIEVSGNPRALQSAIDHTSNNGRIIVGSWYGNTDVSLKLGIEFHRSHKTLQTSQVSTIPSGLAGLWSKERRFALTWALVQSLRPSKLVTKRLTLKHAQRAYELLDEGKEIAICFRYDD